MALLNPASAALAAANPQQVDQHFRAHKIRDPLLTHPHLANYTENDDTSATDDAAAATSTITPKPVLSLMGGQSQLRPHRGAVLRAAALHLLIWCALTFE